MELVLVIAYVVFAVWLICKQEKLVPCTVATAGLLFGGLFIISIADIVANIICWGIVATAVLGLLALLTAD